MSETKTNIRLAMAVVIAILAATLPAMAQNINAGQTWQGHFSSSDSDDVLQFRGGSLYLSAAAPDYAPDWIYLGSTNGYTLGAPGLYVGRLDGTERSSIAFFDPSARTWFWGRIDGTSLTWTPVNELVDGQPVFRIGEGPVLFPVLSETPAVESPSGASASGGNRKSSSPLTAAPSAKITPPSGIGVPTGTQITPPSRIGAPPSTGTTSVRAATVTYPLVGEMYTALARSQHVKTNFTLTRTGDLYAVTRVWEDTWLAGFHAGVLVVLYDANHRPVWTQRKKLVIGVTGRLWGASDVTHFWTDQVPTALLPYVREYAVVQTWAPQWLTFFNDVTKLINIAGPLIKLFTSL